MGNVLNPLAKSVLIPSGLTVAASATDVVIHKKIFGPGVIMNDIMKKIRFIE